MSISNSISIANDPLLGTKQSTNTRWVIACKFIFVTSLQLNSYNSNKITKNMYFYVDNETNSFALIYNIKQNNSISNNIIRQFSNQKIYLACKIHITSKHSCAKIETSLVQTYYGISDTNVEKCFEKVFTNWNINEDDDLCTNTQKPWNNRCNNEILNDNIITFIIHIPQIYYSSNFDLGFYWLCSCINRYMFHIFKGLWNILVVSCHQLVWQVVKYTKCEKCTGLFV